MGWSTIWHDMEGAMGMSDIAQDDPGLEAGLSYGDIDELDGIAAKASGQKGANPSWWEQPLKQIMPAIMGSALKPQRMQPNAPVAPGHSVQANASSAMKPVEMLGKAANNNPLDELNKWSKTFG